MEIDPVAHRVEPIDLAVVAEAGVPPDLVDDVHDLVAQAGVLLRLRQRLARLLVDLAHGDVPLVDDAEKQRRAAAPAVRVAVCIGLEVVVEVERLELLDDLGRDARGILAAELTEPREVVAGLVEGRDDRQLELLAQREVLGPAARGDVDDGGAFVLTHLVPFDDAVDIGRLAVDVDTFGECLRHHRQVIEGEPVVPAQQVLALVLLDDLEIALHSGPERDLADPEALVALLDEHVVEVGVNRCGHVGRHRPGGRRPYQQRLTRAVDQLEADGQARVFAVAVTLVHLHLAHARAAARAPGHGVDTAVEPAATIALGEEGPDEVVVLVAEGEVGATQLGQAEATHDHLDRIGDRSAGALYGDDLRGILLHQVAQATQLRGVVPVHPVAQSDRLLGLDRSIGEHALLAQAHEVGHAEGFDVLLAGEAELSLDVDLHPQALTVETLLPAQLLTEHGVVAVEGVLVCPAPGVVHTHGIVGGDGAVDERPVDPRPHSARGAG